MSGCVKKAYPTKHAAEQFARELAARHPGAAPQYAYLCEEHGCWHLSTQDAVAHGLERSGLGSSRITPVMTGTKPVFTPKKIDEGHKVGLKPLIMEQFETLLDDRAIAKKLGATEFQVEWVRRKYGVANADDRARDAVARLLRAEPTRPRKDIAAKLKVGIAVVERVVRELNLQGKVKRPSGVNHHNFGKGYKERGALNPMYGKPVPQEARDKIAAGNRAAWAAKTPEQKHAAAQHLRGRVVSDAEREQMRQRRLGKVMSAESRDKVRQARLGKPLSEAHRLKLKAAWERRRNQK